MTDQYGKAARTIVESRWKDLDYYTAESLIEQFAAALRQAVEQEREACAKAVDDMAAITRTYGFDYDVEVLLRAATAIRARSKTEPSDA
jgi:methionine synthase II (cobalamin-independent)